MRFLTYDTRSRRRATRSNTSSLLKSFLLPLARLHSMHRTSRFHIPSGPPLLDGLMWSSSTRFGLSGSWHAAHLFPCRMACICVWYRSHPAFIKHCLHRLSVLYLAAVLHETHAFWSPLDLELLTDFDFFLAASLAARRSAHSSHSVLDGLGGRLPQLAHRPLARFSLLEAIRPDVHCPHSDRLGRCGYLPHLAQRPMSKRFNSAAV